MNEKKICPMMSTADSSITCQGERCAWYIKPASFLPGMPVPSSRCAVTDLRELVGIAERGGA